MRWLVRRIANGIGRPGQFGETLVRLAVGLLGLAWIAGLIAVGHSTQNWSPVSGALILAPLGYAVGLSIWQLSLIGAGDTRLAPRRFGVPSSSSPPRPVVSRPSHPDRTLVFETYRRMPVMGILFWSLAAAAAWWALIASDWDSDAAFVKAAAAVAAPWLSALVIRSAMILRRSSSAMEMDHSELRLSPAVGFIPALALSREQVLLLALARSGASSFLTVYVSNGRTYYVPIHNVVDFRSVYDAVLDTWPEHDRAV